MSKETRTVTIQMPMPIYNQLVTLSGDYSASVSGTIKIILMAYLKDHLDAKVYEKVKEELK